MNKKGAMGTVMRAVLALVVIVIVAGVPLYSYASEKTDEIVSFVKERFGEKEEFVPWQGPELKTEEQTVQNSINALKCAMNSALGGYLDPQGCEGGFLKDKKMFFGDKEVSCDAFLKDGIETPRTCYVKGFELPQKIGQPSNIVEWAKSWVSAAEDPKYLLYHESFPQGEDSPWMISEWSFWKDIVILGGVVNGVSAGIFGGFSELKQGIKAMRGISENFVETGLRNAAREFGEKGVQTLKPGVAIILGNFFTREGYERIIKSQMLYKELIENGFSESMAQEISDAALTRLSYYARIKHPNPINAFLKNDFPGVISKISKRIPSESGYNEVIQQFDLPASLNRVFGRKLTKETLKEVQDLGKLKRFMTKNLFKEGTEQIDEKVLNNLIKAGASKEASEALAKEADERLATRTLEYFNYLTGETKGVSYLATVLGRGTKQALDNQLEQMSTRFVLDKNVITRLTTGKSAQELEKLFRTTATKDGLIQIMKNTPVQLRWIPIKFKDLATGKAAFKVPASVLWSAGASAWQTTKLTGVAAQQIWEARLLKYAMLYKIGEGVARIDSNNNKYESRGNNNLVLNMPFSFETSAKYSLLEGAKMYPINLKKENNYARFYTVSPCKSDVKVTKQTCSCQIESGSYVWQDGKYQAPLDEAGVALIGKPKKTFYSFSTYPGGIRQEKIKESCRGSSFYSKECKKVLISNQEIYEKFLKFIYEDFYSPMIDYFNKYNVDKLGGFTEREPEPPASDQKMKYYYDVFRKYKFSLLSWELSVAQVGKLLEGIPGGPLFQGLLFEPIELPNVRYEFVKTIKNKLSFEDFKKKFEELNYEEFVQDISSAKWTQFMNTMVEIELDKKTVSEDSFLYAAAGNASFHYNIVEEKSLDMGHIVKSCQNLNYEETTQDLMLDYDTERYARITTPCMIIEHEGIEDKYENEFDGYNYCYSSEHATAKFLKSAVFGGTMMIDLAIGVWFPPAEVPVAALTGAGGAWALKELDETMYWPQR
ncbi:hypothetical protein HZA97_06410 [Candidatus Woesearchaeota archaeon]|nr:hypothetical protein [Candidatus Woesearchaeota archaeon]